MPQANLSIHTTANRRSDGQDYKGQSISVFREYLLINGMYDRTRVCWRQRYRPDEEEGEMDFEDMLDFR